MFSVTRSSFSITGYLHRAESAMNLVLKPSYNRYWRHNILAFCTSHPRCHNDGGAPGTHPEKIPLADKIRGMHQKARPLALPNLITGTRLALAPATGYFIMNNMHSYALACIVAGAFTDVADKVAAKALNYNSDINIKLDYIADKSLLVTAMICLCKVDVMPVWMLRGLMVREVGFVVFSLILRYASFSESPTLRKYFDLHNHPMLGMEPNVAGRILTGSQYALCTYYLYLASLGSAPSGWALHSLEVLTALLSSMTCVFGINNLGKPPFESRPAGQ